VRIALLGTGKMGAAIARRLAEAGHELTLWNRTPERARAVGVGQVADSADRAASSGEIVLSVLFDAAAVLDVYREIRPRGQLFVEMSTAGPAAEAELARQLEKTGAQLLTAPIVGSVPAIERGSALILAGGDRTAFDRGRPILETFGRPELVGDHRQASQLKVLNNAMLAACTATAAELLAAAGRAGLEPSSLFPLLQRMMPYLQARSRSLLQRDHGNPMFEVEAIVKDLDLALGEGHAAGAAMPMTAQARELYALAVPEHGRDEMSAVIELFEG
jgi:3-hydroxyisobutyrate dehydrogenase-like beta-hydroxyacid dehydrogenase